MEKKPTTSITAGVILALVSIVLFLAYFYTGMAFQDNFMKWIPALVMIALIIIFIIKWANDSNNNVTFGQCFSYGFKMVAMSTVIVFVFTLAFILIFPDYKTQFMEMMRDKFNSSSSQQMTDEQKSSALAMVDKFFMISILGGSLLGGLIVGTIASLIGAGVAKKNPSNPFDQQPM